MRPRCSPTRKARFLSAPAVIFTLLGTFGVGRLDHVLESGGIDMFAGSFCRANLVPSHSVIMLVFSETGAARSVVNHTLSSLAICSHLCALWNYVAFGQLLIIYSVILPDELKWTAPHRRH